MNKKGYEMNKLKFLTKQDYHSFRHNNKQHRVSASYYRGFAHNPVITSIDGYYLIDGTLFRLAHFGYIAGVNFTLRNRYTLFRIG